MLTTLELAEERIRAVDTANAIDTLTRLRYIRPEELTRFERQIVGWAMTQLVAYMYPFPKDG